MKHVDSQAWRRARDGQDQAACGGDLRSVLTTPARDAPIWAGRDGETPGLCRTQKPQRDRKPQNPSNESLSITSVDRGLSIGVVRGTRSISWANARVSRVV